jgi:hypothetical protein
MERDSFIDDLVRQNSWFAKNIVQLIGELSKFKLNSQAEQPFSISAFNMDSNRSSRPNFEHSDLYTSKKPVNYTDRSLDFKR